MLCNSCNATFNTSSFLEHLAALHSLDFEFATTPRNFAASVGANHAAGDHVILVEQLHRHETLALSLLLHRLMPPVCACKSRGEAFPPGVTTIVGFAPPAQCRRLQSRLEAALHINRCVHDTWFEDAAAAASDWSAATVSRPAARLSELCPRCHSRVWPTTMEIPHAELDLQCTQKPVHWKEMKRECRVSVVPGFGGNGTERSSYNVVDLAARLGQRHRTLTLTCVTNNVALFRSLKSLARNASVRPILCK